MSDDYTTVTEVPGLGATREQMSMLYTRYRTAAAFCDGKVVLEVACGSGQGLGYLAAKARRVVGGDFTEGLLRMARQHYGGRVPLARLDAHTLPFRDQSVDVVICYEAIYYFASPNKFLGECRRVLRERGVVLICTVNKEWPDFVQSPFSTRYFSAQELGELIRARGFSVELYGAFPVSRGSGKDRIVSVLKRVADSLHLIPKTMRGKEILKRLFLGKLTPIPAEITDGIGEVCPLVPIPGNSVISDYKVLYAIGRIG